MKKIIMAISIGAVLMATDPGTDDKSKVKSAIAGQWFGNTYCAVQVITYPPRLLPDGKKKHKMSFVRLCRTYEKSPDGNSSNK